jgi:hypothetical protein
MIERRFEVWELPDLYSSGPDTIPLSELIHRIDRIRREDRPMEAYIRILLTGEAIKAAVERK